MLLIGAFLRDRASLQDERAIEDASGPVPWFIHQARTTISDLVSKGIEVITLHQIAPQVGVGVRTLLLRLRRFAGRTFGEEVRDRQH